MITHFGYCQLCRNEEINRYGTVVMELTDNSYADAIRQHERACYDAQCKHPTFYYDKELSPERIAEIDRELKEKLGDDDDPQNDY